MPIISLASWHLSALDEYLVAVVEEGRGLGQVADDLFDAELLLDLLLLRRRRMPQRRAQLRRVASGPGFILIAFYFSHYLLLLYYLAFVRLVKRDFDIVLQMASPSHLLCKNFQWTLISTECTNLQLNFSSSFCGNFPELGE